MNKFSTIFYINAYADPTSSTTPSRSFVRWQRQNNDLPCSKPISQELYLAPGETQTLFDGTVSLSQDGTTQYSISPKAGSVGTYVLQWVGGTNPVFRTARTTGADATTQVQVTLNATIATYTSIGGTPFNFTGGGVQVGDSIYIDTGIFSPLNQGYFQVIAFTATSVSIINPNAAPETQTLGSAFATQMQIFSAAGVQTTDSLSIFGGFSAPILGAYAISQVYANRLEFFSTASLPTQTVTTDQIAVYSESRQLIYMESDQNVDLTINGIDGGEISPYFANGTVTPGQFLRTSQMWSLVVQNTSLNQATVFLVALE